MREKDIPRWLLPVLVFIFLAAIFTFLFVRRLGGREPLDERSSLIGAIQPGEVNPDRRKSTQPRDSCSLLMPDEIEDELGIQLGEPFSEVVDNPIGEMVCTFPGADDEDFPIVSLVVVYTEGIEAFLIQNGYSVNHLYAGRNVSDRFTKPVPDIGDDAFWGGSGVELWNGLHVLIWDVYLQIDVNSGDEGNDLEAAQNLALIALNRLFNE
ncbi:MAG: hypothetical protein KAJ55_00500 [Anaerolineales bacterium]|jgi:hypothetical protein|nr:hypothetical protein [Anaerolineales bacterium]